MLVYLCEGQLIDCWLNDVMKRAGATALANGLQRRPRVGAAHLQVGIVVKDVVAQFLQRGFRVRGGKLSSIFDLLPHRHVDLLQAQRDQKMILVANCTYIQHISDNSSGILACLSFYSFNKLKIFATLSSSTLAMLLLSMRSFNKEMGSLFPRTSWISSRVR